VSIKPPEVAGAFYPASPQMLSKMLQRFLADESKPLPGRLRGLVAPHAGYIYSGPVAGRAFSQLKRLDQNKHWRVILVGPSHRAGFRGASVATDQAWQTPLGDAQIDGMIDNLLCDQIVKYPEAFFHEHCLEVEVPFLQATLQQFSFVPILTGNIEPEELASALEHCIAEDCIIVASTDLSHFHTDEQAKQIDAVSNEAIPALDIERFADYGEACGKTGVLALMHLARRRRWQGHFLDYQTSGDTAGDRIQVVGYGAYAFTAE